MLCALPRPGLTLTYRTVQLKLITLLLLELVVLITQEKSKGSGVCLYFNKNWCNNYVVKEKFCCEDIELLAVGLQPFYLPREFSRLFITVVYIHPKASNSRAIEILSEKIESIDTSNPDAINLSWDILINVTSAIPILSSTLTNAPVGNSDHNTMYLLPLYKQTVKQEKQTKVKYQVWSEEVTDELSACFSSTDWSVFYDDGINKKVTTVNEYIHF
ncbi:hypothetical protein HOLleu_42377 [Holothuria leucospilota]|uniref:Uncharacterized protein n=1 Tax=Holothuria leucospilota TaxID=206669 RepID=A0A9Q0YAG2_HOLLE|nr:hypothetical protein HOLleu_42377 [Holothuria leucospilota]